jgi:hypothetical protein
MSTANAGRRSRFVSLVVLLVVGLLAYSQAQHIIDWVRMHGYQPPAAVAAVADQTTMTAAARHLFYLNRPDFQDKTTFRKSCPNYEATIVIGCYRQGEQGIFVLKVDDPRLSGVEQVTAAHEMLHAAYNRLNFKDRKTINGWLESYARDQLTDARIKATLQNYQKTEPGEQDNEMYAIFGTEIDGLPATLEQHYAKYFSNRHTVVKFANSYQSAFASRQQQVKQYDDNLNTMSAKIKVDTQDLEDQRRGLTSTEAQLQAYRQAGQIDRYNTGIADYNQQVVAYNSLLDQTKVLIGDYNQLVIERNNVATETNALRQAIDSNALPQSP